MVVPFGKTANAVFGAAGGGGIGGGGTGGGREGGGSPGGIGDGGGESQLPCRAGKDERDEAENQVENQEPKEHKA